MLPASPKEGNHGGKPRVGTAEIESFIGCLENGEAAGEINSMLGSLTWALPITQDSNS